MFLLFVGTGCATPTVITVDRESIKTQNTVPVSSEIGTVVVPTVTNSTPPSRTKDPNGGAVGLGAEALIGDYVDTQEQNPPKQPRQLK